MRPIVYPQRYEMYRCLLYNSNDLGDKKTPQGYPGSTCYKPHLPMVVQVVRLAKRASHMSPDMDVCL